MTSIIGKLGKRGYEFARNIDTNTLTNEEIRDLITDYVNLHYDKPKSKKAVFTNIRLAIQETHDDWFYKGRGINLPEDLVSECNKIDRERLVKRDVKEFDIKELESIVFQDPALLTGYPLLTFVLMVTGRRLGDIMDDDQKFELKEGNITYYPRKVLNKDIECSIDTLLAGTPENILEIIIKVREHFKGTLKNAVQVGLQRYLKQHYKYLKNGSDFRKAYLSFYFEKTGIKDHNEKLIKTGELLCQAPASITQMSYNKTSLVKEKKKLKEDVDGKFKCNACDSLVTKKNWSSHLRTLKHLKNIEGDKIEWE